MIRKAIKSDYWFAVCMLAGLALHIMFIFSMQPMQDESFYPSIALRVLNGDTLMQDEWHMTQFSSVFLYLPVKAFLAFTGSADGIILYLRILFLALYTLLTIGIYIFFRKYGGWAVVSAIMFFTQTPYRILAISYNSMYMVFLILFICCILLILRKKSVHLYVLAGMCFAACCVSNPFFCSVYFVYILFCFIWAKKQNRDNEINSKKREKYNCFFSKKASWLFFCGISVTAVMCIAYYFLSGGTFASFFENIPNLFSSTEYFLISPIKIKRTLEAFNTASFHMPFLLPILFIALAIDKNKRKNNHRALYLIFAFVITVLMFFGIYNALFENMDALVLSMPFSVFSFISYVLTEKRNKELFYCAWIPCVLAAFIHYIASNTILVSIGIILAVNNIIGVFFVRDLFEEMRATSTEKENKEGNGKKKRLLKAGCSLTCIVIFIQIIFQCYMYQYGRIVQADYKQVDFGPYAYFYMNEDEYDIYVNSINDLNEIKARSNEGDNVLILSDFNWMYLYIDRPVADFTTWPQSFKYDVLKSYFDLNSDKIPQYIYIDFVDIYYYSFVDSSYDKSYDNAQAVADRMSKIFNCTQEHLSNGILLTVA